MKGRALCCFLIAGVIALLCFSGLARVNNAYADTSAQGKSGTAQVPAGVSRVFLNSGFEVYLGALTPSAITNARPIAQAVPGQYQYLPPGSHDSLTYCLTLTMQAASDWVLAMPEVDGDYTLYVNNTLVADQVSGASARIYPLPDDKTLACQIVVTGNGGFFTGLDTPPAVGTLTAINHLQLIQAVTALLPAALALVAGSFFAVSGLKERRLTQALYAALCAAFAASALCTASHLMADTGGLYLVEQTARYLSLGLMALIVLRLSAIASTRVQIGVAMAAAVVSVAVLSAALWASTATAAQGLALLISLYKGAVALLLLLCLVRAQPGAESRLLSAGAGVFTAALIADRLYPLYQPIAFGTMLDVGIGIFILALFIALLRRTLRAWQQVATLKAENSTIRLRLDLQEDYYRHLSDSIEASIRIRHDFRQHCRLMRRYLDAGNIDALSDYLDTWAKSLPADTAHLHCEHRAASLMIDYYFGMARSAGIAVNENIVIPASLSVSDTDLCIFLGNALENAVDACTAAENPSIDLTVSPVNTRFLAFRLVNTCANAPAAPGTGLRSMQAIVERCGGSMDYGEAEGSFTLSAVLPI